MAAIERDGVRYLTDPNWEAFKRQAKEADEIREAWEISKVQEIASRENEERDKK